MVWISFYCNQHIFFAAHKFSSNLFNVEFGGKHHFHVSYHFHGGPVKLILKCVKVFPGFSCFSSFALRGKNLLPSRARKSPSVFPLFHNLSSLLGYLLAVNWFDLYDRKSYKCALYWKVLQKGKALLHSGSNL